MRDILFKAKRIDNGEWVEGSLIARPNSTRRFIVDNNNETALRGCTTGCSDKFDWRSVEVDPNTICQYTGLTDKNGNKIWENDVVEIPTEDEYFHLKWEEDTARFVMSSNSFIVTFDNYWSHEVEVIGNIFDNPELLEG